MYLGAHKWGGAALCQALIATKCCLQGEGASLTAVYEPPVMQA
jgi:hypothetical protein